MLLPAGHILRNSPEASSLKRKEAGQVAGDVGGSLRIKGTDIFHKRLRKKKKDEVVIFLRLLWNPKHPDVGEKRKKDLFVWCLGCCL